MSALKQELKEHLIQALNLQDVTVADIADDAPLFGEGLGLDSIDALELIVLLDKQYQVKLSDPEKGKTVFYSINSMAEFIESNKS